IFHEHSGLLGIDWWYFHFKDFGLYAQLFFMTMGSGSASLTPTFIIEPFFISQQSVHDSGKNVCENRQLHSLQRTGVLVS
ncbi:MAG: hypothetical protein J6J01_04395, partial [Oscillospiraceae bacterium]|nr:hypothetical protein [Oscillospiraceae bacterium]